MESFLGPIWQLAYVVDDLEAGVMRWVERGAGPFFRRAPEPAPFFNRFYGGDPPRYDTDIALGQLGSQMIELIMPPEGGVEAAFKAQIEAAPDPEAARREIHDRLERLRSPFRSAERFYVEEIIAPSETRRWLAEFAELAAAAPPSDEPDRSRRRR